MSNKTFCSIYFQIRLYMDVVLKVKFRRTVLLPEMDLEGYSKSLPLISLVQNIKLVMVLIFYYNTASTCIKTICK